MNSLLLKLTILTKFLTAVSLIMHVKGPTHKKIAENCLEEIARRHFHFQYDKSDENHTMLLTVLVTNNMTSPAFEIQENVIKRIHENAEWYQVEIVSSGERHEFESYSECSEDDCQKRFIIDFKSNFYVIVVDDYENVDIVLDVLEESNTYNPKALYLVYIEYNGPKYRDVAEMVLRKMWRKLLLKTVILIPKTLQVLTLYKLNSATAGPYECSTNITLLEEDQCAGGSMVNITKHYFKLQERRNYLNCSLGVISKPYVPYVINQTHGFEIEVLQAIAGILNIHFNITVTEDLTDSWGSNENDTWTGRLKYVYENCYLGIGNIETGMSYATEDFSFSRFYHMEPLVFVVPIARFVPKWRVLVAIFTVEMWGVCVGIIIFFAISFYVASKFGREVENYRKLGDCLSQSYQIIILHAVPTHPRSDLTRVFFVSLAVISIIMASAYTCSLVYYLKNPIREYQPTMNSDILDKFGNYKYGIGGISRYKELFIYSSEDEGTELYRMYETSSGENDTLLYWIGKVAEDTDIWTISSKLFANYLLAQNSNITTDQTGKPKIYVFKKQLLAYSISIIARKGHPLLKSINFAIKKLMWAGLVIQMSEKYSDQIQKKTSMINEADHTYKALTTDHLQGAFAFLMLGWIFGFVALIFECVVKKYKLSRSKKLIRKRMDRNRITRI